jgi:RNA 3'-terminal phosphate cyclase
LDNVSYEIELSTANAARLSEGLARFVENGKKVQHPQGGKAASRRGVPPVAVGREHVQAVQEHLRSSLEALGHAPSVWVFSGRLAALRSRAEHQRPVRSA